MVAILDFRSKHKIVIPLLFGFNFWLKPEKNILFNFPYGPILKLLSSMLVLIKVTIFRCLRSKPVGNIEILSFSWSRCGRNRLVIGFTYEISARHP